MDLTDTTVLVTGANRGMGRSFVERLAREPVARILAGARTPSSCEPFASAATDATASDDDQLAPIDIVPCDLSSRAAVDATVAALADAGHEVDVLINNAGRLTGGLLENQPFDDIESMLQVNLNAVIQLTQALLPQMIERGRGLIVNNASISGYTYLPAATTYAASKAGVVAFSESLRRELAGTGVSVMHLVTPRVETDMAAAMDDIYAGHVDTASFTSTTPEEWADTVVRAMRRGEHIVGPGGRTAIAKLASRGPAMIVDRIATSMFTREPGGQPPR